MAILKRIPKEHLHKIFTHKGVYAGIVPVYIVLGEFDDGEYVPQVPMYERNWVPGWSLGAVNWVWRVLTIFYPHAPPLYITGDIRSE